MIGPMDDAYPTCAATYATLLFYGDGDPAVVGERLGLAPTSLRMAGRPGRWVGGEWRGLESRPARRSVWASSTRGRIDSLDCRRHLAELVGRLDGRESAVRALVDLGWEPALSVFWESKHGHGGPTLDPAILTALARLGIGVSFDVYGAEAHTDSGFEKA